MVALGIEHEHRVAEVDELLGQQAGDVGLPSVAHAPHQHVHLRGGHEHRLTLLVVAHEQVPARRVEPDGAGDDRTAQRLHDAQAVRTLEDDVGEPPQRRHGVGGRHPHLARLEHGAVVLGVADGDGVVRRGPELGERSSRSRRLRDTGRHHHQLAPVGDELVIEAGLGEHRREHRAMGRLGWRG